MLIQNNSSKNEKQNWNVLQFENKNFVQYPKEIENKIELNVIC